LDVARATHQLEKERALLVDAKRQRDVLSTLVLKTIGHEARSPVQFSELMPRAFAWDLNRDAVVREALESRPERRSTSEKGIVISRENRAGRKQRWPKLDFNANYGALGQGPDRALGTWQAGASLTVPIWTSGRIENDIKAARYRRDQWKQQDRQLTQAIEQEITQAILDGKAAAEQLEHLISATGAARSTLELARLRYEAGKKSSALPS